MILNVSVNLINLFDNGAVTGQEVSWIFLSCEHDFVLGFWFLF
jgi:hypothetical protein